MATIKARPAVFESPAPENDTPRHRGFFAWLRWKFGGGWKHWRTYRWPAAVPGGWRVLYTECWHNERTGDVRYVETVKYEPLKTAKTS